MKMSYRSIFIVFLGLFFISSIYGRPDVVQGQKNALKAGTNCSETRKRLDEKKHGISDDQKLLMEDNPYHVKTISQEDSWGSLYGSNEFLSIGNTVYFTADDVLHGEELWRTDGTAAGTHIVKDIWPGPSSSYPHCLTNVNGIIFFVAMTETTLFELWKTDGTENGTVLVKDINTGIGNGSSNPRYLTNVNGVLFFSATDSYGTELWKSDGTSTGTILVKDIIVSGSSYPRELTDVNGELFFTADAGNGNVRNLWKSDGTEIGTVLVLDNDPDPKELININGILYFAAQTLPDKCVKLWRSDGSEPGTYMIKDLWMPSGLTNVNGTLYFTSGYTGHELWKSDGTTDGTILVKDCEVSISNLINTDGVLYFRGHNSQLWKSDGTEAGTVVVKDSVPNSELYPKYLLSVNGTLFFRADDGEDGFELWKSDGTTAGTVQVKDINPGVEGSNPRYLINSNGIIYFVADDGVNGVELWRSDGTQDGTQLVLNISRRIISVSKGGDGSTIYFSASITSCNYELWKSDGTEAGTYQIRDIMQGEEGSYPRHITIIDGTVYFSADDGINGCELWKSDGTEFGTMLVKDIFPGPIGSEPDNFTVVNGSLFFTTNSESSGRQLWKSDGTEAGTILLDSYTIYSNPISNLTGVGGALFYVAMNTELFRSDGTPQGTVSIKNFQIAPDDLTDVSGTLYFAAGNESGYELWKSDGTYEGTTLVKDICVPGSSNPENLTSLNGVLFFVAKDRSNDYELWKSDGTSTGTVRVKNICVYPDEDSPSFPENLTNVDGTLFFSANNGIDGEELWKSDGSEQGTAIVRNILEGAGSSFPQEFVGIGDELFFVADEGSHGYELWKSDGTMVGTTQLTDINSGAMSSGIGNLMPATNRLYFSATSLLSGESLWFYSIIPPPTCANNNADDIDPCADTGVEVAWPQDATAWNDDGNGSRSYDVIRNGVAIASDIAYGTTSYIDTTGNDSEMYLYQVRYRNGYGLTCTSEGISASNQIGPVPLIEGPSPACLPASLETQTFNTYQWYRNNSIISGAIGQYYQAVAPGNYSVLVTDSNGCQAESPSFIVYSNPQIPVIIGEDSGCGSVQLTTGAYAAYQWIRNGADITEATNQSYLATESGIFSVRVNDSQGCSATSTGHQVTIYSVQVPVISGEHFNICPSISVILTTDSFDNYQWYFNDHAISGATSQSLNVKLSGNYKVETQNEGECSGISSSFQIFVDFCPDSEVSPSEAIYPVMLTKDSESSTGYFIYFQRLDSLDGYNIYEGNIVSPWDGDYHHYYMPGNYCDATVVDLATGQMRAEITPSEGAHYYLVTAYGGGTEGPIGFDSMGIEIAPGQSSCSP